MMSDENIFLALAKLTQQDENYLTESFVFIINTLLIRERSIGLEILNQLCVNNDEFSFDIDEDIYISTQERTEQGTPDISVFAPNKLIYIEVKHDSPVDPEQLKRYKKQLDSLSVGIKRLILLTKFPIDFSEHQGIPDKHVRWFEVFNRLTKAKTRAKDPIGIYLVDSFKSFLEVKQMSIQKVGWEYINGVPALTNLINMLEVAIQSASIPIDWKSAGWDFKGFSLANKEFWCGIHYNNPLVLTFEMMDRTKFNAKLVEAPSYIVKEGKERMWFRLPLEDIHFFALDKDKQLEEITKFVRTAYAEAQKMRIPH